MKTSNDEKTKRMSLGFSLISPGLTRRIKYKSTETEHVTTFLCCFPSRINSNGRVLETQKNYISSFQKEKFLEQV